MFLVFVIQACGCGRGLTCFEYIVGVLISGVLKEQKIFTESNLEVKDTHYLNIDDDKKKNKKKKKKKKNKKTQKKNNNNKKKQKKKKKKNRKTIIIVIIIIIIIIIMKEQLPIKDNLSSSVPFSFAMFLHARVGRLHLGLLVASIGGMTRWG